MRGLLFGQDAQIVAWAFATFNFKPMPVDLAIGIIEPDGSPKGAILFHNFNGNDAHLSYYGPHTMTPGIIRAIARAALALGCRRVTVTTAKSNKRFVKAILRLGFTHECARHCFYGPRNDKAEHTGMQMVLMHEKLLRLAQTKEQRDADVTAPRLRAKRHESPSRAARRDARRAKLAGKRARAASSTSAGAGPGRAAARGVELSSAEQHADASAA